MSSSDDTPATLILRSVLLLGRRLRAARPEGPHSLSTIAILATLRRLGPMPAWRLALEEHLQPQSVTRIIAALERDGLISRMRSKTDRREIKLSITPHGRTVLSEDIGARRAWLEKAMNDRLTPEECKRLMEASEIMLKLSDSHIEDEAQSGEE